MDQNASAIQTVQKPAPQPSAPAPPPASSTPPPRRFSKKILLIVGIVLVVIIGIILFFFMQRNNIENLRQTNINQPDAVNFPYAVVNSQGVENVDVIKEMAKEISDYVLSQRRPDGYYNYLAHYDEQCTTENGETTCPFDGTEMFQTTNAWTALALFSGSQILGDSNLLQEAKTDLNKLEEYCALDRAECNWVLAQPAIIYQTTQDPELLEFLRVQGETLLSSTPSDNTMLVAIEARELAMLYEIFDDTRYIVAAQNRLLLASQGLNGEIDIYPENTAHFSQTSCWVSLANAEIAIATENVQEKNNTSVFLENGNINTNFDKFLNPIEIQPCIESYTLIDNSEEAKSLLEKFIDRFYDGQKRKLIYGDGGTAFQPTSDSKMIVLTDSAYTLYLVNQLLK